MAISCGTPVIKWAPVIVLIVIVSLLALKEEFPLHKILEGTNPIDVNKLDKEVEPEFYASRKYLVHHAFSSGCSYIFDWESIALIESWIELDRPTNLTRILACKGEPSDMTKLIMRTYPEVNHFIALDTEQYTGNPFRFLNKPAGCHQWIHQAQIQEPYIVITDSDLVLMRPWNLTGLRKGHPLGGEGYNYGWLPLPGLIEHCTICNSINVTKLENVVAPAHVYIAHKDEMLLLVDSWLNLTIDLINDPKSPKGNQVDMTAYMLGALNTNLLHEIKWDLAISLPSMDFYDYPPKKYCPSFCAYHYAQTYPFPLEGNQWHKNYFVNPPNDKLLDCNSNLTLPVPSINADLAAKFFLPELTDIRLIFELLTKLNRGIQRFKQRVCANK